MNEAASASIRDWLEVRARALGAPPVTDLELIAFLTVLARTGGAGSCLQIGGDAMDVIELAAALATRSRLAPLAASAPGDVESSGLAAWWVGEDVELARAAATRAEALGVRGFRAILGPPLEVLAALDEPFDLLMLAGPSAKARRWLDAALPRLARGGMVVATSVFAEGRAFDLDAEDAETRALRGFPGYFLGHPQLAATILPIAGGLALGGKLESLVTERGGPY